MTQFFMQMARYGESNVFQSFIRGKANSAKFFAKLARVFYRFRFCEFLLKIRAIKNLEFVSRGRNSFFIYCIEKEL